MPYSRKGKCVYKKNTGKKVGCSKNISKAKKYIKALHANVENEEVYDDLIESLLAYFKSK